jgi:hypothetical protein
VVGTLPRRIQPPSKENRNEKKTTVLIFNYDGRFGFC